jgi:hypothetical protein
MPIPTWHHGKPLFAQIWKNPRWPANFVQWSGFQTFSGTFHHGSLPNFTNSFMDVKYSPSLVLSEFGQNPRWLPGSKHSHIGQNVISRHFQEPFIRDRFQIS